MIKKLTSTLLASIFVLASTFIFSASCKRNKECDAVINVVDGKTGVPVGGAYVHIHPSQTAPQGNLTDQDQEGTADASGSISFHFKVPAILQAEAGSNGLYGMEYVKLEEGKQVSKTIKVY